MLTQAILVGLVGAFGGLDYQLGTLYAFRPIVLCPLVGLVLGDLQTGLAVGASLELLFMGSVSIGAYVPPNETIGGVLACAFAIQLGQGTETAIALAMPIAVLSLTIGNIFDGDGNKLDFTGYRADCINDFALEYLESGREADKPFFLFISQLEPHHQNDHHHCMPCYKFPC